MIMETNGGEIRSELPCLDELLREAQADCLLHEDITCCDHYQRWTNRETALLMQLIHDNSSARERINWIAVSRGMPGMTVQRARHRFYYIKYMQRRLLKKRIKYYTKTLNLKTEPGIT